MGQDCEGDFADSLGRIEAGDRVAEVAQPAMGARGIVGFE